MSKQKVFLIGATGETGGDIVEGLLEDGSFDVSILVRPESVNKENAVNFRSRGVKIVTGTLTQSVAELTEMIRGFDTVISAIDAMSQLAQLDLVAAAAAAGVKRFIPCGFITICPRGGILDIRDQKETVHDAMFRARLPFTIIDVGFWYQIAYPRLPSGRIDYAHVPLVGNTLYGEGNQPDILIDRLDIGRFVARIIKDPRTLNQRIITVGEVLSQNQVHAIMEAKSGEKLELTHMTPEATATALAEAREAAKDPMNVEALYKTFGLQYAITRHIRGDNSPENAKYLGYLDSRDLYPDFKPVKFAEYFDGLLAGKGKMPYTERMRKVGWKKD